MKELYSFMGFTENPFSRYSAEEELDYLNSIFSPPKYYNTVYTDIKGGNSRFIFGERGVGKTALMRRLKTELDKNKNFTVFMEEYDEIPLTDNNVEFLVEVLRIIVTNFSIELLKKPVFIKKLNDSERESLSFFILIFFRSISKTRFESIYNKASGLKSKNVWKKIINYFLLKPMNTFISGVSEVLSSTISNSLGLNKAVSVDFYKEYIPEIDIPKSKSEEEINRIVKSLTYKRLKNILEDLQRIIIKCGYYNLVIFFDKIDEYSMLRGNIKNIANFTKGMITDTSLLQLNKISFVFGIWGRVSSELNKSGLRFDKFKPIDINWSAEEVQSIINKRLKFFSNNIVDFDSIVSEKWRRKIIEIANKSPRHLIMLLDRIYDEQAIIDIEAKKFNDEAVEKGIESFIKSFDYHSLYPGENSDYNYIIKVINRTLKVGKVDFKQKDVKDKLRVSNQIAEIEIETMKNYALIADCSGTSRGKRFNVIDPKIKHLINKGFTEL